MKRTLSVAFLVVAYLCSSGNSFAAFVNGVETFDGTAKDTATWLESTYAGSNITQNDALIVNKGDYTTKMLTVGVGQSVSARMTLVNPVNASAFDAYLLLTTDSGGATSSTTLDSRCIGIQFDTSAINTFVNGFDGNPTGADTANFLSLTPARGGETFIAQVDRSSLTSARVSVRDAADNLLGQTSFTFNAARGVVPADLKISLFGIATYDDVTITPEPATLSTALAIAARAVMIRRPKSHKDDACGRSSMAER